MVDRGSCPTSLLLDAHLEDVDINHASPLEDLVGPLDDLLVLQQVWTWPTSLSG